MNFQVKGTVENVVASGTHAKGPWFLYAVKENISHDKTKTWRIFSSSSLTSGVKYDFTGYISESPNKMFKNDAGKFAYQTTYNATSCQQLEAEIPF